MRTVSFCASKNAPKRADRLAHRREIEVAVKRVFSPQLVKKMEHIPFKDRAIIKWMRAVKKLLPLGGASEGNTLTLHTSGDAAFGDMWKHIDEVFPDEAKYEVNMETYILGPDNIGSETIAKLEAAAKRGVKVTFLYDSVGSMNVESRMFEPLRMAGGQVIPFNPIKEHLLPWKWGRLLFRNHRKMLIVDDRVAFCGGMNIAKEYCGTALGGTAFFRDTLVRVEGPAVQDLHNVYDESMQEAIRGAPAFMLERYRTGVKKLLKRLKKRASGKRTSLDEGDDDEGEDDNEEDESKAKAPLMRTADGRAGMFVQVLQSNTNRNARHIQQAFRISLRHAIDKCLVTSPYFLPSRSIKRALAKAARRGLDVRILTSGKSDVPIVRLAAQHVYSFFLKRGIRIFEMHGKALHAKTVTIDGIYCTIGTFNLDFWSSHRNLEVNLTTLDPHIASQLEQQFLKDVELSREITLEELGRYMAKSALRPIIGSLLQERDQRKIVPFLLTYRIQFSPEELWEQLSSFSNVAPSAFIQFALLWLDCSYDNIALPKALLRNVITLFEKPPYSDEDRNKIKLACIRSWFGRKMRIAPQVPPLTIDQPLASPEQATTNIGTFLSNIQKLSIFSVSNMVEQLCVLEHSLLCQITPREIISKFRTAAAPTPHLSALARFFNIMVYWIASKVLTSFSSVASADEGAQRVSRSITEIIMMLDAAMQLRNFSLVAALSAGLNQLCVERLPARIWDAVDPSLRNMLGTFTNFASPLKNYQEYRTRVTDFEAKRAELAVLGSEHATDAMLPLMPVVLRDMTIIHEGNPDMLPAAQVGGELKVNWEKLGLLGTQLARLDEVKKRKYPFRADPRFARLFLRCAPLTEAELHHQLSYIQKCLAASGNHSTPAAQFVGALITTQQTPDKANVITGREAKAGTKFAKLLMEDRTLVRMMLDKVQLNSTGRYGQALARIFHSYNADQGLIRMIVTRAVEQGDDIMKVFHESTVFSDLASEYMRLNGTEWLRRVMRMPLKKLLEHTTPEVFECYTLTPSGGGARSVTFSRELTQLSDEVISSFLDEVKHIPSSLRTAINPLAEAVDGKFGAAKRNVAIGGLVFFRFVCPAVADPIRYRVVKGPITNNATKRALVHLSKVLKACVTNPDLNNPEATEYVRSACLRLEKLYNELRKPPTKRDPPELDVGQAVLPSVALLKSLNRQWKLVEAELLARNAKSSLTALEEVSQEAFDNIQLLRSQSAVEQNALESSMNSLTGEEAGSGLDSGSFDDESSNAIESSSSNSSLRSTSSLSLSAQVVVSPSPPPTTSKHGSKKEKHKESRHKDDEKHKSPPSPHLPVVFQCACPDGQTRLVRMSASPSSFSEFQQTLAKELKMKEPSVRYQDPSTPSALLEVRSDRSLRSFLSSAGLGNAQEPTRVYHISVQ